MSQQPREVRPGEETILGTVKAVNFAPKGEVDGLLIEVDGETIQVNIPPGWSDGAGAMVGQVFEATVGPEPKVDGRPKGAHPVRKLVAFRGQEAGPRPKPDPRPDHHGPKRRGNHGEPAEVSGRVERLNYAKHGEANGVVLAGGDFVHLRPEGMKTVGLEVGREVTARGEARPSPSGARAIEAEAVNGVGLRPGKEPR